MSEIESAEAFARRFSDDYAESLIRERDAAIRREAEERIAQLERDLEKVRRDYQETVAKVAEHRLDGYRELGQAAAAAELAREAAEAQVAELRAALQDQCVLIDGEHCYCIGTSDGVHEGRCDAIRAALARTPAEALARQQAVARVVEAAREVSREFGRPRVGDLLPTPVRSAPIVRLYDALAALDGGAGDE